MDADEPLFSGIVDLVITQNQDGSYHYTDDGGADFDGHLCGNQYKFGGGVPGSYGESGTITITSAAAATKFSVYRPEPPDLGRKGGCRDMLTMVK